MGGYYNPYAGSFSAAHMAAAAAAAAAQQSGQVCVFSRLQGGLQDFQWFSELTG